jgi:hypothetical protein
VSIPFPNPVSAPPAYRFATASATGVNPGVNPGVTAILAPTAGVGYILYSCTVTTAPAYTNSAGTAQLRNHSTGLVIGGLSSSSAGIQPASLNVNLGGTYLPVGVGVDVTSLETDNAGIGFTSTASVQYLTYSV